VQYGIYAFDRFSQGDMWNGAVATTLALIHVGFAALSILGLKASITLPPVLPVGGLAVAGEAGGAAV